MYATFGVNCNIVSHVIADRDRMMIINFQLHKPFLVPFPHKTIIFQTFGNRNSISPGVYWKAEFGFPCSGRLLLGFCAAPHHANWLRHTIPPPGLLKQIRDRGNKASVIGHHPCPREKTGHTYTCRTSCPCRTNQEGTLYTGWTGILNPSCLQMVLFQNCGGSRNEKL